MLVKGYVTNNTGRSRHIFKRTVYPGQRIPLDVIYSVVMGKVPEGTEFVDWLEQYLPSGWEVSVADDTASDVTGGRKYKEVLTAIPVVVDSAPASAGATQHADEDDDDARPSLEYATPRVIDKMTARDIYNLRLKDNPRRIIKQINSIHKLRRALTLCKNDSRKATLIRLIQGRIRELNVTL